MFIAPPSYTLFHPIAYIVKLNIELTMADLIAKIACSPHQNGLFFYDDISSHSHPRHSLASWWCPDRNTEHGSNRQVSSNVHRGFSGIDRDLTGISSILPHTVSGFTEKAPQTIISPLQNKAIESTLRDADGSSSLDAQ